MSDDLYVDTSALAKWYLNEPRSEELETFLRERPGAAISTLTAVEMRCLLARRRRAGDIDRDVEMQVFAAFQRDIDAGHLRLWPVTDRQVSAAVLLLARLPKMPLRTLDAIHLAIAVDLPASLLATADRVQADAAEALGMAVARFHG